MTSPQENKVYVAVGNELQDGFKTLQWALQKWKSHPISITILHITYNITRDFVHTPFGKLPASSVSDEKLEVLKKYEKEKINKLLSKYIAFCGKVKAEILRVEKNDTPIHKLMVDLISGYHITNLVIGLTFMKSSTWRSKNAIGGSFYIHQKKPDFCEFFIVCGGKQVFIRAENDGKIMEDNEGLRVAKMKDRVNFKAYLDRMLPESLMDWRRRSSNLGPSNIRNNQGEHNAEEIENYFQHLLSLNLDEVEDCEEINDTIVQDISPVEAEMKKLARSNMSVAEKLDYLKTKKNEALKEIQTKCKEADANIRRQSKAQWAICLCNRKADELDARTKEEALKRLELKKELDSTKELMCEARSDIEESKDRLNSLVDLQSELSTKLQSSSIEKSQAEWQLEKAVSARVEMVRNLEELRQQRDVLRRRIEFCREKGAVEMAARMNSGEMECSCREYSGEAIRLATDDYSERLRLKSGGDLSGVYRGRISHDTVAIKFLINSVHLEDFQPWVKFVSQIRHPHVIAIMGFCSDPKCIVLEYMHSGNLRDVLFTSRINFTKTSPALPWHHRIRILAQVFSGLRYLHLAQPRPIIHGSLSPSNILLDRNLVPKITGFGLSRPKDEFHIGSDIRAFGLLVLYLLTGRNWDGLVNQTTLSDAAALVRVLDATAGEWPLGLAQRVAELALRCVSMDQGPNMDMRLGKVVMEELEELRKEAEDLVEKGGCEVEVMVSDGGEHGQDSSSEVPSVFLCPIFQEVMDDPYVAADGFSYDQKAIEEWLRMGRDTSPMTNLRLKHTMLTPNHTLRCLIQDWHSKRSTNVPP